MPSPDPGAGAASAVAAAAAAALGDWLAHAERLHVRAIDLSLARVREVAGRLDVALRCPTVVVAGTNGKGSTCAMLESILRAAGYRTAVDQAGLVRMVTAIIICGQESAGSASNPCRVVA